MYLANAGSVFRKACDEGDNAEACHRYSAIFINGIKDVCEKNMTEAFKYSLKVGLLINIEGKTASY